MLKPHVVDFRDVVNVGDLAVAIGVDIGLLRRALAPSAIEKGPDVLYIKHEIPKRRDAAAGKRIVWDVQDRTLRDAHRAFARRFDIFLRDTVADYPSNVSYGYIRGRGIKANATCHRGAKVLLCADIAAFFSSITRDRLTGRLLQVGCSREGADLIGAFSTLEGSLALGLNGSCVFRANVPSDSGRT